MMSSNLASAEAGGYPDQQQSTDDRWVAKYSGWFSTMGAIALVIVGGLGAVLNIIFINFSSALANVLQVVAAAIILAIEGSSAVAFLSFAKPIGAFFEGKPIIVRALLYGILTVVPMLFSPSALGYLGFLISAGITAIYGVIVIGKKGSMDDMRAAAAGGGDIPKI